MTTFVLVHGSYQGGWIWQRVVTSLRSAGHTVYAPTMDGCAERRHAAAPGYRYIDLCRGNRGNFRH